MSKWKIMSILGFELTGLVVIAIFLGRALDAQFATSGIFTGSLVIFAFFGWIFHMVKLLKPK
jgi:hypothetical protein